MDQKLKSETSQNEMMLICQKKNKIFSVFFFAGGWKLSGFNLHSISVSTSLISHPQHQSRHHQQNSRSSPVSFCEISPVIVGQDEKTFVTLIGQFCMK